jgi:hypothetical protein
MNNINNKKQKLSKIILETYQECVDFATNDCLKKLDNIANEAKKQKIADLSGKIRNNGIQKNQGK